MLLKRVYDVRLVGDDEPIPLARRPEVVAMYVESDAASFLRQYARLGRKLADRLGPSLVVLLAGTSAGGTELRELFQTINGERPAGTRMVALRVSKLGALRPGLSVDRARDAIWTLNSTAVWHLLTGLRGWSGHAYGDWIASAMCTAVLRPTDRG